MEPVHIAWAAGLFEGEGSITNNRTRAKLNLAMTDKDVVEKFASIIGYGNVNPKKNHKKPSHWKDQWEWSVGKQSEVRRILSLLLPYLGNRRAYKALNILDDLELSV